jgi:catechol 2,3-dioxygenase-like lactoylglutathione lyase family enzyme
MSQPAPTHPQRDPPVLGEHGGHVVYAMPAFLRLSASDPVRTVDFFTRVLDFDVMFRGPEVGGVPVLVHLRRAKYQDVLVMPLRGAAAPGNTAALSLSVADADALDALAARVRAAAPDANDGPADTPWNAREATVRDPDGNRFVLTTRAREPRTGTVDEVVRGAARTPR